MAFLLWLISFLNNFHIQLLAAEFLFLPVLKRKIKIYQIALLIILYSSIPYLFPESYFWNGFRIGSWFTMGFLILLLCSAGVFWLSFNFTDGKEFLFYLVAAMIFEHFGHSVDWVVQMIRQGEREYVSNTISLNLEEFVITVLVYTACYWIFVKRLKKDDIVGVKRGYLVIFAVISIFFIYILNLWSGTMEPWTVTSSLFDSFSCLLLLLLLFGMFEFSSLERKSEMMKQILHMDKEKHVLSKENIELLNLKFHDLKYLVSSLQSGENSFEKNEAFSEIQEALKIYDMSLATGNQTLDILLAERNLLFVKHDIRLSCVADGKKLDFMSPSDIYSLFGNALDNAVESVRKIENPEKRVISLNITSKGNYVIANLSNYYEHEIAFEEGLPVTTKEKTKYHGFGMKSIRHITEKYGGSMSIQTRNQIFILNIILPA